MLKDDGCQFLEMVLTARLWGTRPSAYVAGLSGYAAYCLDAAAALALSYLEQGRRPAVDALSWFAPKRR